MLGTVLRLLPAIIGMTVGFLLRRSGVAQHRDGDFLFRLVFYVTLPPLMFTSLSTVEITRHLAVFPAAALIAMTAGYLTGRTMATRLRMPPAQAAIMLCACMIVNTGFALPFVQALYGADGVARVAAFDAVNIALTFTWAYYAAARGNPEHEGGSVLVAALLRSPPLYGIAAGLAVNLAGVEVPAAVRAPLDTFGAVTAVLISLGVGILFEPPGRDVGRAAWTVGIRLATGLAVGLGIVAAFDLGGMDRTILLLLAVAPVGFISVTFASLENLDVRLAVNALSLSTVSGFVLSLAITLISA